MSVHAAIAQYLVDGCGNERITDYFDCAEILQTVGRKPVDWVPLHQKAYIKWRSESQVTQYLLDTLAAVDRQWKETAGEVKFTCRLNHQETSFTWQYDSVVGRISIQQRPGGKRLWKIGVKSYQASDGRVLVTGFTSHHSNLPLSELRVVLHASRHLFPQVYPVDVSRLTPLKLAQHLSFPGCYVCGARGSGDMGRCPECYGLKCEACSAAKLHWGVGMLRHSGHRTSDETQAGDSKDTPICLEESRAADPLPCRQTPSSSYLLPWSVTDASSSSSSSYSKRPLPLPSSSSSVRRSFCNNNPPAKRRRHEDTCVVCMDSPPDTTVEPCMHCVVCAACADALRDSADRHFCLQCRGQVKAVYYPDNQVKTP